MEKYSNFKFAMLIVTIVIIIAICVVFIGGMIMLIYNLFNPDEYYLEPGWSCDAETFNQDYCEAYTEKLEQLQSKYQLTHENKLEFENGENVSEITFNLYCVDYTIVIKLICGNALGHIHANLYYYRTENLMLELDKLMSVLSFMNDFINYASYDSITEYNAFETLVHQAIDNENKFASDIYHSDSIVGNIGYYVNLKELNNGYYYMALKDLSVEKQSFTFDFHGLLKPLPLENTM